MYAGGGGGVYCIRLTLGHFIILYCPPFLLANPDLLQFVVLAFYLYNPKPHKYWERQLVGCTQRNAWHRALRLFGQGARTDRYLVMIECRVAWRCVCTSSAAVLCVLLRNRS